MEITKVEVGKLVDVHDVINKETHEGKIANFTCSCERYPVVVRWPDNYRRFDIHGLSNCKQFKITKKQNGRN